jgi:predicted permease
MEWRNTMNMDVLNQVLMLFIIMLIGYYAKVRNIINDEINKGLSQMLLRITLPMLIVSSFNFTYSPEIAGDMFIAFWVSFLMFIVLIIINKILFPKFSKDKKIVLKFMTAFSNCGFMGFPLLLSVYGKMGVLYGAIFNINFNLFIWTYGLSLYTEEKGIKNIKGLIVNPGILSVLIGVIRIVFSIKFPTVVQGTLEMIGSMTTPLSMIIIGAMLSEVKVRDIIKDLSLYYGSVVKLFLVPLITLFIMRLLSIDPVIANTIVLIEAMPTAATCGIFAESTNRATEYSSKIIFVTTLFSVITIPLWLAILI